MAELTSSSPSVTSGSSSDMTTTTTTTTTPMKGLNKNPFPQSAPGAKAAIGHVLDNGIPLSIFPISASKLFICVCGLPARGKTHIARRVARYLEFFHAVPVTNCDVAEMRRKMGFVRIPDLDCPQDMEIRINTYHQALSNLERFFAENDNGVGILDAALTTHELRSMVKLRAQQFGVKLIFIEVINNDPEFLQSQIKLAATSSPDYAQISQSEEAESDYQRRILSYQRQYTPLDENHNVEKTWSFVKCDYFSKTFTLHNMRGHLPLKIANFVMNIRVTPHPFYLTRHGQSEYNVVGRIGGDSGLTEHGLNYAKKLAQYVEYELKRDENGQPVPARLWTSTMRRTIETAQFIQHETILVRDEVDDSIEHKWIQMRGRQWFLLDEIFAGACDGMTYAEIEEIYPEEAQLRKHDKLAYRYPRGESYLDVIARLEPLIIELERHREPVLIIGHQGILRIIFAFYTGLKRAEAPYVSIPLNTVIKLIPSAHDVSVERRTLYRPTIKLPNDGQDEIPEDQRPLDTSVLLDPPSH